MFCLKKNPILRIDAIVNQLLLKWDLKKKKQPKLYGEQWGPGL